MRPFDMKVEDFCLPGNAPIGFQPLSENVYYVGYFRPFGALYAKKAHKMWKAAGSRPYMGWPGKVYMLEGQRAGIASRLSSLKNCIVLSTTPSYYSQYLAACLLKEQGFHLVNGKCYKHPGYFNESPSGLHPGNSHDKHDHWEHVWWKVIGTPPKILGEKINAQGLNNCGVLCLKNMEEVKFHAGGGNGNKLAVAWLPAQTALPTGWTAFYTGEDFKLCINFDSPHLREVKKCDHNFDVRIFDSWEPDLDKPNALY